MATAIADAALLLPAGGHGGPAGPQALVLCAAEHGFVGGFHERLVTAALAALRSGDALVVLGRRGALPADEKGRPAAVVLPMAPRRAGVPDLVGRRWAERYPRLAACRDRTSVLQGKRV